VSVRGHRFGLVATLAAVGAIALASSSCAVFSNPSPMVLAAPDTGMPGLPTDDPAATRRYLAGLTFETAPTVQNIQCHNGPASISIHPETRSHQLSPQHARLRPHIVARIQNTGTTRCQDLYLDPGEVAYWWTGPNRGYPLTTDFWRIPDDPAQQIRHLAQTGPTVDKTLKTARTRPEARIGPAPLHEHLDDPGDGGFVRFAHNSTWIACLGGCCESAELIDNFY
jgi:hypothetical protein